MPASSLTSVGSTRPIAISPEIAIATCGVAWRLFELAQPARDLAVDRERVDVAGDAEHRGRRRPRRGPARRPGRRSSASRPRPRPGRRPRRRRAPAPRRTRCRAPSPAPAARRPPAPPSARSPPCRRRRAAPRGRRAETIRFRSRGSHVDVGREVGGGLDPGVGEHREHRGVDDVGEAGSVKRSIWSVRRSGCKTASTPTTITASCRTMSASASTPAPLAAAAGDVEDVEHAGGDDHRGGDRDLPARLGEISRRSASR